MPSPMSATRRAGHRQCMSRNPYIPRAAIPRMALLPVLALLVIASSSLAACGDDADPQAERDARTPQEAQRDSAKRGNGAERETRAIAEELKELQRDVAASGRQLVEGTPEQRNAAESELRRHEQRARQLADRAERNLAPGATARADLRAAARQTATGVAELRQFSDRNEDRLTRANEQLRAAEGSLRSVAESLRDRTRDRQVRRALEELRERVPEIPAP